MQYWKMTKPSPDGHYFVGVENYANVFQDEFFWNSARVTVLYMVVTVAFRFILGFGTALTLNTKFRGCGLARALIIIPGPSGGGGMPGLDPDVRQRITASSIQCSPAWGSPLRKRGLAAGQKRGASGGHGGQYLEGVPLWPSCCWPGCRGLIRRCMRPPQSTGYPPPKLRYITWPSLKPVSMVVFLLLIIWTLKDYRHRLSAGQGRPRTCHGDSHHLCAADGL